MNLPSITAIAKHFPNLTSNQCRVVRRTLEMYRKRNPLGDKRPTHTFAKLLRMLPAIECDSIPQGNNARSPEAYYIKADDTYDTTLIWTPGRIFIGNIGSLIEAGNYP